jgi:hypothetical protein
MSVTVPKDQLIAEIAHKLASESLRDEDHIIFPQITKGIYHSLASMVRESHENNYEGRHSEQRIKEENFPESMFEFNGSPFKRSDTNEELGHFIGASSFYLDETREGLKGAEDNPLLTQLQSLKERTLFALNERQIQDRENAPSIDARDAIRTLASDSSLFNTEYGLNLYTDRLLVDSPQTSQYIYGRDVLAGLLSQGFKPHLHGQILFAPRSFPYEDGQNDHDLHQLFSEVAKSGGKNKIPTDNTLLALNILTSKVRKLSDAIAAQPVDKIAGLDGVKYNAQEKYNLVDAVREMSNGLANVAIAPYQILNSRLPFEEAKNAYAAERSPSEKVYLYLPLEQAVGFELNKGNLSDALHSAYQNNQGVVTSEKNVAALLQDRKGGSIETFSVTPLELRQIPSNLRGPHALTSAFIKQAAYAMSDEALNGGQDAIRTDLKAFGISPTDALMDAMESAANEVYPSMDTTMKQQVMGTYATSRLKPKDREEFEGALLLDSNSGIAGRKNK